MNNLQLTLCILAIILLILLICVFKDGLDPRASGGLLNYNRPDKLDYYYGITDYPNPFIASNYVDGARLCNPLSLNYYEGGGYATCTPRNTPEALRAAKPGKLGQPTIFLKPKHGTLY